MDEEGGDHSVLGDVDEVGAGKLLVPKAKWRLNGEWEKRHKFIMKCSDVSLYP